MDHISVFARYQSSVKDFHLILIINNNIWFRRLKIRLSTLEFLFFLNPIKTGAGLW